MTKRSIKVRLEDGLDARPVALLVQEASKYESNIYIEVDDKRINAKSIMGMMSLGLCAGEELTFKNRDRQDGYGGAYWSVSKCIHLLPENT